MKKKVKDKGKIIQNNILTISIVVFALIIRLIGIYPGHHPDHPDEQMSYVSAVEMVINNDFNPRRFDYPIGVPLMHYLFFQSFVLPPILLKFFLLSPQSLISYFFSNLDFMSENRVFIFGKNDVLFLFASRFLTALLGTASIYLVYEIGKRLFSKYTGLAAAFFLAFNYRHVLSSHLALPDVPNGLVVLLVIFSCVMLLEKDSKLRYLICGLMVGFSFSMKYQIFALFPFLFVHVVWVIRRKNILRLIHPYFIFSLFLIPMIFIVLNPHFFIQIKEALPVVDYVSLRYGRGTFSFNLYVLFFLYKWGIGVFPFLVICLGIIVGLFKYPVKTLLLLSYISIFLYIFLYYMRGGIYVRNFTTVMPLLMIFAGVGFMFLTSIFKKILNKNITVILSVLLILFINIDSIKNSSILSLSYIKPWNRDLLSKWAYQKIPNNSTIINETLGLPLNWEFSNKSFKIIYWGHAYEEGSAITEFIEKNYDFAVSNVGANDFRFYWLHLPYQDLIKYQGIPYSRLRNSYHSLAISEYKNYLVYENYKPWQSPDNNYLVMKIPKKPQDYGKKITSFSFNGGIEGWRYYDFDKELLDSSITYNNKLGYITKGSLEFSRTHNTHDLSRAISPFIPIKSGKLYTVEGFIKPKKSIESWFRDGFLRLDFYTINDLRLIKEGGITSAVSGRIFGPADWMKKRIITVAPKDAKYMTISFQFTTLNLQVTNPSLDNIYLLDDVNIYESDKKLEEKFKEIPYIKSTTPDEVFFPKSIY